MLHGILAAMKIHNTLLCSAAAAALLALSGCVTQATQSAPATAANTAAATAPTLANTASAVLGNVLQANGGAAGLMSSMGVPTTASASNAAGVLTYCAKNNYLSADNATTVANQLLTSLGLPTATGTTTAATQDQGYLNGIAGMIVSPTGELFSLDKIKGNVKDKACDFVMSKAQAFL